MGTGPDLPRALVSWIREQIPGRSLVRFTDLAGGHRNDNVAVATDRGEHFVVRRYLVPETCAVELAVMERVRELVAVPGVVAADVDGSAAGEPVVLLAFVDGELLQALIPSLDGPEASRLGAAVGETLARIGTVRFGRAGFFTKGDLDPAGAGGEAADLVEFVTRRLDRIDGLDSDEKTRLIGLAERNQPLIEAAAGTDRLVHADFNAKNLIVSPNAGQWQVSVLDWEFAYSGHPLADVANMLRFPAEMPPAFEEGFLKGFRDSGGVLGDQWRETSQALDLFALADLLTRPVTHPLAGKVREVIRHRLS